MRFEKWKVGYSVRDDFDLASRHVMNGTKQFAPFSDMTMIFAEASMIWRITSRWAGVGLASTV